MGHVQGSTFGFATPTIPPQSGISWGLNPYAGQPFGVAASSQPYGQPFSQQSAFGSGGPQLQQVLQFLQVVPQHLQQLQFLQQQQLAQTQQLLQFVPAQLQQLQQLIQLIPHQIQSLQQQQPYASGFAFGLAPQAFTGPGANYVM